MTWTLRHLISEATSLAGLDGEFSQSVVSRYVNLAYADVAARLPLQELEALALSSTSSGQNRVYIPADCEAVLGLSWATAADASSWLIPQRNIQDFDRTSDGTFSGTPDFYVQYSTWLELYPSPNSAYSMQLRYRQRLSDLTDLDQVPSLNTRFHPAILYHTAELLAARSQQPTVAQDFYQRYEHHLRVTPNINSMRMRDRAGLHANLRGAWSDPAGDPSE